MRAAQVNRKILALNVTYCILESKCTVNICDIQSIKFESKICQKHFIRWYDEKGTSEQQQLFTIGLYANLLRLRLVSLLNK